MPILTALLLAAAPPAGTATLVLYRDYAEPLQFAPTVRIDGVTVGNLGQKRLLSLDLPPGEHRVELAWPDFATQPPAHADIRLEAGARHYLELRAAAGFARVRGASALVQHPPEIGAAAAGACCRPAR